jgi:hypothetical protein
VSELAIIEIAPDLAPSIYVENGLDKFLEQIREGVNEVPDLSTAKGRARIASLAAQVSRSKTAVEKPGRDYLKRLKEQPKVVEAELRRFVTNAISFAMKYAAHLPSGKTRKRHAPKLCSSALWICAHWLT